jgi:DNA-binding NarL/FixJ family response regulator
VSVIDRFEQELLARLRELRPLALEYQQLEQVARRLGLALDDERTTPSRKRKPSRTTTSTQRVTATAGQAGPTRKASAATALTSATGSYRQSRRQQDVLRLINDHPGITVKEIATELDVDATNLYRHVRKLQQDDLITKHGTALRSSSH